MARSVLLLWSLVPTSLRHAHILVAEDDPDLRRLLAKRFDREGYSVLEAEDGFELMDSLSASEEATPTGLNPRIDLVVSDVRMPGRSALEVLRLIRQPTDREALPVVLITAFCDPALRAEALALGASCVLDKPVDLDELCREVKRALRPSPE
jgi:CheY-like chemotaxis protein